MNSAQAKKRVTWAMPQDGDEGEESETSEVQAALARWVARQEESQVCQGLLNLYVRT